MGLVSGFKHENGQAALSAEGREAFLPSWLLAVCVCVVLRGQAGSMNNRYEIHASTGRHDGSPSKMIQAGRAVSLVWNREVERAICVFKREGGPTTKQTFLDQSKTFFLQAGWCQPAKQNKRYTGAGCSRCRRQGWGQARLLWFDLRETVGEGSLVSWSLFLTSEKRGWGPTHTHEFPALTLNRAVGLPL